MSNYNQNQQAQGEEVYVHSNTAPPPPVGYPVKDGQMSGEGPPSTTTRTQSRGDGFWKGCCAALCCCCVLDACF